MARPKSNGPYAPLSATYFRDDAILEIGEEAELMFVRCLAFLADAASDGFITERQMLIVVGMGLDNVPERVDALVKVGLLEHVEGGYLVRSWLKWNKSTAQIGKHLKRDRERKSRDRQKESEPVPDGIRLDSALSITTNHFNTEDVAEIRPDVSNLCNLLADLIEGNGSLRPTIGKGWEDAARLMLDKDGRPAAEAEAVLRWSQASDFWRPNIMSMPKFREKYDQLRMQSEGTKKSKGGGSDWALRM